MQLPRDQLSRAQALEYEALGGIRAGARSGGPSHIDQDELSQDDKQRRYPHMSIILI